MPRRVIITIGVLGLFLAIVFMVALHRNPPDIPADARHVQSGNDAQACLKCHGPGGSSPRTPNHPLGSQQCWSCHYRVGEAR